MMGKSFGFSPAGLNQVILFNDEEEFKEIVAANPDMTVLMGGDGHDRKGFPNVFVAGLKASSQTDKWAVDHIAIQK